ncbi:hypothetical protein BJX62DRAFT_246391 [Aspergillus germanicus]
MTDPTPPSLSAENSLKVAIVGGGLAGTLAARVLREQHQVTIYERDSRLLEVGAAINVGPNGVKILESLGFDRNRVGSILVGRTLTWNKEGELKHEAELTCQEEFGADWLFNHRADLREEFFRLATAPSAELKLPGLPAAVRYGTRVIDVDVDEGSLTLENGEVAKADLIIAADGIKSLVRGAVVQDAVDSARLSGFSAFRFTIERTKLEALRESECLAALDPEQPASLRMIFAFDSTKRSVVLYPCRDFQLLNFVCIVPDSSLKEATTESWSATGDRDELVALFADFPPWVLQSLEIAENTKLWQLRDQDPLSAYTRGRTVLIGDAAHAMTPHQGQGGTQAVEDAEGFRLFLGAHVNRDNVPDILRDFDRVRRPRASQIQNNTRKAAKKRTAEEVYSFAKYNWTYPGIREGLRRLNAGEELIQFK